jgi:hypothetical protein
MYYKICHIDSFVIQIQNIRYAVLKNLSGLFQELTHATTVKEVQS